MFTTDERTENFLKLNGIQFEYCDCVKYLELHPEWKFNNLGRKSPIDNDAVLDYSCRMEGGSAAPAPITIPQKDGHCVLDGVQRLSAGEINAATSFCAYVVSKRTSMSKQRLVRICANGAINGQHTPDKTFLLATAVRVLFFDDNCSAEEIARAIGRKPDEVHGEIRFQKTAKMMEAIGYRGWLSTRQNKWFASLLGEKADRSDWEAAPGALLEMIRTIDKCKFRNGNADKLLSDFFDVKRSRKDRHGQFQKKVNDLKKSPEVQQHLKSDKSKNHLDNVLPSLRGLNTTLEKAIANDEIVHDAGFAKDIAECVRLIYVNCRAIIPRDLQYQDNRRSSIFDKG